MFLNFEGLYGGASSLQLTTAPCTWLPRTLGRCLGFQPLSQISGLPANLMYSTVGCACFFYHIQPPLDYHGGEKVIPSKRSVPLLREPSSCLLNFNLPSCYFHRYFLILFSGMIAGKKTNLHLSSYIVGDLKDHSSQK